jgi:diaminopimelate decarboxylase
VQKRDTKADELCVLACVWVFCRTNAKWVEMTSVHWYKATAEKDNTPATLLDEDQIRSEMENFKKIVEVSNR